MPAPERARIPDYLGIPAVRLGEGTPVKVRVVADVAALARDMSEAILAEIRGAAAAGRAATLIVPVGPVDQFPILAATINADRVDCRDVCVINMDEYLGDDGAWLDATHPLSFRGFMDRVFYERLDASLAPRPQNRLFPDPDAPRAIEDVISRRGGVDACFGGIGINGHIAFNEPADRDEHFADLGTRVVDLTPETRTINSVTVGGEMSLIPRRAVTVGMRECLSSRKLRFYCNRPWQSAVVRRALHGPLSASCPASFLRTHGDAQLTVTEQVAQPPQIRLR